MIRFIGITKKIKDSDKVVLSNINLSVKKGDFVYIVGPSGAGKTTLFKMIYGEMKPTVGNIFIDNIDITEIKKSKIPDLRRSVGVVFQDFKLLKKRTVFENIAYPMEVVGKSKKEIYERVNNLLILIGIEDKKDSCVDVLSAGEKQRVTIARAVANRPKILLCDEITGHLNHEISQNILMLLTKLNAEGMTILFSTHDKSIIEEFPKRIIEIEKGVIINES